MRLHPLSVAYRTGASVTRLAWVLVFLTVGSSQVGGLGGLQVVGLVSLALLLAGVYQVLYYQRFEYELTDDSLDISSGVLSRRDREIPLDRVQNVDISSTAVGRVLGIAAVGIETAGGSDTEASLRYVGNEEAKRLQNEISRLKRGATPDDAEPADTEDAREAFAIGFKELFLLGAVSVDLRLVPVLSVALSVLAPSLATQLDPRVVGSSLVVAPLLLVGFYLLSAVLSGAVAVTNYYGFRLTRGSDELRYERGLLQRYSGTIPLVKVQSLTVRANFLARAIGYASLAVETAGYGQETGSQSAIPFARREKVNELVADIEGVELDEFERPPKRARQRYAVRYTALALVVAAGAFAVQRFTAVQFPPWLGLALVPVALAYAHYAWKLRGVALLDDHVVTRNGVFVQTVQVVPYHRVQTLSRTATWFARRRQLATLVVDTAGSSGLRDRDPRAVDFDEDRVGELRAEIEERFGERIRGRRAERRRERVAALQDADTGSGPGPGAGPTSTADD
jgi:putative membrane protein